MVIDLGRSALLEIDVQNDFCPAYTNRAGEAVPAGALAVPEGDWVIEPLNRLAAVLYRAGGLVAATQDWHPHDHISFASNHPGRKVYDTVVVPSTGGLMRDGTPAPEAVEQVLWPDHCVQRTPGARLHDFLDRDPIGLIIYKGNNPAVDSYSAFFENDRVSHTALEESLRNAGVNTVFIGGLATDYCVLYTALDAVSLGFETVLLTDAVRGVGSPPGSVERAMETMRERGVSFMNTGDLL
jgi:nicotinamidase/pyrazinamidase